MAGFKLRMLPAVVLACFCGTLLRGMLFLNGSSGKPVDQRTIHHNCQQVSSGSAFVGGSSTPSIIAAVPARPGVAAHYSVTLQTPPGLGGCPKGAEECEVKFECSDETYILDKTEELGIDLPYSCRAGSCALCAGKVLQGTIDQLDQTALDDDQVNDGYCMVCVAYPTSDVTIRTHCEDQI